MTNQNHKPEEKNNRLYDQTRVLQQKINDSDQITRNRPIIMKGLKCQNYAFVRPLQPSFYQQGDLETLDLDVQL